MGRNVSGYVYLLICLLKTTTQETIGGGRGHRSLGPLHFPGGFCGGCCQWRCSDFLRKELELGQGGKVKRLVYKDLGAG